MNSADHFEAIVNEHYEGLYRFALSLTRSESDALDLTQHTFHIWATKGHQLRDLSRVKGSKKNLVSGSMTAKMNRNQKPIEEKEGCVVASLPSPRS